MWTGFSVAIEALTGPIGQDTTPLAVLLTLSCLGLARTIVFWPFVWVDEERKYGESRESEHKRKSCDGDWWW